MRPMVITAALLAAVLGTSARAEWVAFSRSQGHAPEVRVQGEGESFTLDLTIPGLERSAEGRWTILRMPGQAFTNEAGAPELPRFSASVLLPDSGTPRVTLEVLEETTLQLTSPVAPARGHVTRDVPLSTVPRTPGAPYQAAGFFPGDTYPVEISAPYVLRDVRGASLRVVPVLFQPSTGTVRVLRRARLHVEVSPSPVSVNALDRTRQTGVTREFVELYKSLFVNLPTAGFAEGDLDEAAGRAIVITPDEWVANLEPLLAWREVKGLDSKVLKTSEIGSSTAQIRAAIQAEFEAGGLTYVLLVGDADKVPTLKGENESADCDACYVKLAGNDHVPDAFISRFSAKTAAEVDVQVARAVKYERDPVVNGAFYRKATGIASNEGTPTDYSRMDILFGALKGFRMDEVDRLYDPDRDNWIGQKAVKPEQVVEAVNQGRSVINYMGHGSKTEFVTSGFSVQHIRDQLTNDKGDWPMVWSVACVNGDFVHGDDCFGEAWAKAGTAEAPKGAIGIVAASTNMAWHPPVDWQGAVIMEYMIPEKVFTGGAQHHYGLVKAMEKWGTDASSDGVQMVEQCIFFGDSSVVLRNDFPRQAAFTVQSTESGVMLKVACGEKPIRGARIVCRSGDTKVVRITDAQGQAEFPAMLADAGDVKITVTGPNLVPLIDQPMN